MANTKITSNVISDDINLGGNPTTTTQSAGNNTTRIATTAFVKAAIDATIDSAPGALDTLNELAAAIGDDANFSTTITNSIATKAPLASPTFTGTLTLPGSTAGTRTIKDSYASGALANQGFLRSSGGNYWAYSAYQDGSDNWKSAVSVASERSIYAMDEDTAYWSHAPSQTVSIGSDLTTQPTKKIIFDLENNGAIQIGDSLGSGYGLTVDPNTQYGAIVQTTESSPSANPNLWCRIDDDGTVSTLFRVQNNGNVSVGNTTPDNLLHIYKGDSGSTYTADGADQLILENSDSVGMDIRTPSSNTGLLLFSDNDARGRGQLAYFHSSDAMAIYTAGAEVFRWDSSGNILMQNGSPEFHFGTSSASHANWRVAVQEVVNQGFEIASGTTSAGANALSDTYTTRFQITNDGEVKIPGTTAHTYMHIAANSGVGAANKYTSGSTTFTAGMDTAAGIPDNMYGIVSGSSGSSAKALIADSSARVTMSHGNPNGLGRLSVHGTVGHGNVIGDPDISRTYTNVTAVDGSTIELVSATAFTVSDGDTCVVTWNKGSWASVMYDAQIAFASGGAHQTGSFYHNNSGSAWSGHVVKEHYDNTGRTWINYGGSNQTVIWTFDFPSGYHPILRLKITAGGGSGYVAANEFTVEWTT